MVLFQKKPVVESSAPLYQIGLETTLLIVGLGNVGKEYDNTRHNIGFEVLDNFALKQDFPGWIDKKDLKAIVTKQTIGSARTILAKPTTYMNKSGDAVQALQHYFKVDVANTLVVHDDIDVKFGHIRLRAGGSSAGNNGLKSVIEQGGENTLRMRIGVGPKKPTQIDSADFVLAKFSAAENKKMPLLKQESNSILSEFVHGNGELIAETRNFII